MIYANCVWLQFGYKLACVDDQFNKLLKSYLGRDAVYSFFH